MKIKFHILVFIVLLGISGQTVYGWLSYSKLQTVLVEMEEETKNNEKTKDTEKDKFFEYTLVQPGQAAGVSYFISRKVNFQSSLFHSLPERPPSRS